MPAIIRDRQARIPESPIDEARRPELSGRFRGATAIGAIEPSRVASLSASSCPYPPFAIPVGTGSVGWRADLPRSQVSGEVAPQTIHAALVTHDPKRTLFGVMCVSYGYGLPTFAAPEAKG